MLHIQINASSGLPVYRQVMDQIRYYVAAGQLVAGAQLPSIRELARALSINPTTIVKAYTELEHAGDIQMIQGKGAFVTESAERKSQAEVEREFRRLAAPLAAAGVQMGLTGEHAARLLCHEFDKLIKGGDA